jgi:hypothetical protein
LEYIKKALKYDPAYSEAIDKKYELISLISSSKK